MSLRLAPKSEDEKNTLSADELRDIDAYWRAANYLSIGQIYLLDNPLLRRPLTADDIKPRLLGHWGTTPGLNFIYAHMNRLISRYDVNAIYVAGPGHGGGGADGAFGAVHEGDAHTQGAEVDACNYRHKCRSFNPQFAKLKQVYSMLRGLS